MTYVSIFCTEVHDLFEAPLTVQSLSQLSRLTECENLSGKFTATLPPCWQEVQQEQVQRKHPQHLQQSVHIAGAPGSSTDQSTANATRTWRLQVCVLIHYMMHCVFT